MPVEKKCSKCNATFECKADSRGCWCENYTVSTEALQHLKDNFRDCLCPQCLAAYQTELPGNNPTQ